MSKLPGELRIISGTFRGRKVPVLSKEALRPTPDRVRETIFNWLMHDIQDAKVLNLFAGTGILGFESLSRGASLSVMVDMDAAICRTLTEVRQSFGVEPGQCPIHQANVISWIQQETYKDPFDIIFMDPPFHTDLLQQSFDALKKSRMLGEHTILYTELDAEQDMPELSGYEMYKQKKAGKVVFCLYRREILG